LPRLQSDPLANLIHWNKSFHPNKPRQLGTREKLAKDPMSKKQKAPRGGALGSMRQNGFFCIGALSYRFLAK